MMNRWVAVLLVFSLFLAGCAARVQVKTIEPLRLEHTYSIVLATSYAPDEVTRSVIGFMKRVMEFENQEFTPVVAEPLQLKGSSQSLAGLGDTLFLIKRMEYSPPPEATLRVDFDVLEYDTSFKASRTIEVICHCPGFSPDEALEFLAETATRWILEGVQGPVDAFLSTGFGGLGDGGAEGGEAK
ncbi:MAG: hypothetical protein DRI92_02675 [Aquificota bacterium]|nr:MAG: hypothetical protein DRI92_02675 [Aquificota bacterium]